MDLTARPGITASVALLGAALIGTVRTTTTPSAIQHRAVESLNDIFTT